MSDCKWMRPARPAPLPLPTAADGTDFEYKKERRNTESSTKTNEASGTAERDYILEV